MIHVLAHNIRSMHNVGSIFRTCDGAGVSRLYLTGYTACPPRREIKKTALGADESVTWKYYKDPVRILRKLKKNGVKIIALERHKTGVDITRFRAPETFCLVIGNEVDGVESPLMELADHVVEIPMHGKKESLNVSVAFGIAVYSLKNHA